MTTVRDATFDFLRRRGMTTMFGNPGSTELPMLAEFPDDFTYVLGLQEAVAVGMADGYAQASGKPTMVNLHTAPGVGNGIGANFNAQADQSPLLVAGPDVDASGAWDTAIALAERQHLPVWAIPAPGGGRLGFPEGHPNFVGILPPAIGPLSETVAGHDLVLVVGASVFSYYPNIPGPLLPEGTSLVAITSDPDEAARAPMGDAIVADVALMLRALLEQAPESGRAAPEARPAPEPAPESDPISPSTAVAALAEDFPENGIVVA